LHLLDTAGARPWAERAASELRAAGVAPVRAGGGPDPAGLLTPQELQVARLAARGLTNKEIADQLYLSHRTVGDHLYRTYPKLGITARGQLRDALAGAGRRGRGHPGAPAPEGGPAVPDRS
jgi:DNA-binding NarL/FixJ family response regulator